MRQRGFTIVELLIVIVVIGILAAITLVAFNGVQTRAKNTNIISKASAWQKYLLAYKTANGAYPVGGHVCLGVGHDTDWDDTPAEDCAWSANIKHPSTTANTLMSNFGEMPSVPNGRIASGATTWVGGISLRAMDGLNPGTPEAVTNQPTLLYFLEGTNQDCSLRPLARTITGGLTEATAGQINTQNEGTSATRCQILLPL